MPYQLVEQHVRGDDIHLGKLREWDRFGEVFNFKRWGFILHVLLGDFMLLQEGGQILFALRHKLTVGFFNLFFVFRGQLKVEAFVEVGLGAFDHEDVLEESVHHVALERVFAPADGGVGGGQIRNVRALLVSTERLRVYTEWGRGGRGEAELTVAASLVLQWLPTPPPPSGSSPCA